MLTMVRFFLSWKRLFDGDFDNNNNSLSVRATLSGGVVEDRCRHFKSLPLSPRASSPHRTIYIIRPAMYIVIIYYTERAQSKIFYIILCAVVSIVLLHLFFLFLLPLLLLLLLLLLHYSSYYHYSTLQSPRPHCHALQPPGRQPGSHIIARSTQFQLKSLRYQFIIRDNNIHNHLFVYMYI